MPVEIPCWLNSDPDEDTDHRYLSADEIAATPDGVFYKKKAVLTRHRFVWGTFALEDERIRVELVDDRGSWRIPHTACLALGSLLRSNLPLTGGDQETLRRLGLAGKVLTEDAPLPRARVVHPVTTDDIKQLYSNYTDLESQGHFDVDSPDLLRLEAIIDLTPDGATVVDLGCNSGGFGARLIARKDCKVAGVDLDRALVARARSRGVDAVVAFAERTPFERGSFEVALCCELLEHVLDPNELMAEARRLLSPRGLLLITVPHADGQWGSHDIPYHSEHLRAYTEASLKALLVDHGFTVRHLTAHHYGHAVPQELICAAEAGP